jgi:hypothetical protein
MPAHCTKVPENAIWVARRETGSTLRICFLETLDQGSCEGGVFRDHPSDFLNLAGIDLYALRANARTTWETAALVTPSAHGLQVLQGVRLRLSSQRISRVRTWSMF